MAEIEPQPVGRDERALLRDMRPEHALQGGMEQMCGGMVCARGASFLAIDLQIDEVANDEVALRHLDHMDVQSAKFLFGVDDPAFALRRLDRALVADLS